MQTKRKDLYLQHNINLIIKIMFRYKFNKEERTFHITSDEGDSFYVKNKIPQMGDFQEDKIDEYGNFFCKLFSEYCLKSDGDTSFVVYKVFIDLHFYHSLGCGFLEVWSDNMAQDERKRIGQQIKELRLKKNMEAKELAKRAGIDASNISKIEQGKYSVGFDILTKVAWELEARLELVPLKDKLN